MDRHQIRLHRRKMLVDIINRFALARTIELGYDQVNCKEYFKWLNEWGNAFYRVTVGAFEINQEIDGEALLQTLYDNFYKSLSVALETKLFPPISREELEHKRRLDRVINNLIDGLYNPPPDPIEGLTEQWRYGDGWGLENWLEELW